MKYYKGAHDRIIEASRRAPEDQCLFLVPDVNNKFDKDAVMLHDGVAKLGHIAAGECAEVKRFLEKERLTRGQDAVLVVHVPPIKSDSFNWSTSFNVKVVGIVYERIARKFAQSILKKEN
jgi:hypothetical protein